MWIKQLFVLQFVIGAIGCSSVGVQPISKIIESNVSYVDFDRVLVDIRDTKSISVEMSFSPVDGDGLANSGNAARQQLGVGGFVGTLAAISISKSVSTSSAQSKINSLVRDLRDTVELVENVGLWSNLFSVSSESIVDGGFGDQYKLDLLEENENRLVLKPNLFISGDYRSVHLLLVAELYTREDETLYRKQFNYISKPLAGEANEIAQILNINERNIFQTISKAVITETILLVKQDINEFLLLDTAIRPVFKGIRYQNASGKFYERGELISSSGNRMVFRTLRGGIKSVHNGAEVSGLEASASDQVGSR